MNLLIGLVLCAVGFLLAVIGVLDLGALPSGPLYYFAVLFNVFVFVVPGVGLCIAGGFLIRRFARLAPATFDTPAAAPVREAGPADWT